MSLNPDTGEWTDEDEPQGCARCRAERQRADAIQADLENAEKELRRERRAVRALKAELARQRRESVEGRIGKAIFRYWVARCQKPEKRTKFGEKREKAVVGRLRDGYSPEYIARAIDGLAVGHFIADNGVRYDDLELACRNEVNLERFYRIAEARKAPTLVGEAWRREFAAAAEAPPETGDPFSDVR